MPILILAKKDLGELFGSSIAYVFMSVFLFVSFWLFFSSLWLYGQADTRPYFGQLPLLFLLLLPAVTMGRWSEEKRLGTHEILFTLPVGDVSLLLGKWLATLVFLGVVLLATLPMPITLASLGDLDVGVTIASYIGAFLMGAAFLAFGLFMSSLTRNQIVAFLVSVLSLFMLYLLAQPVVTDFLPDRFVPVAQTLSFATHFESMARGVIDSRDVVYFLGLSGLFLYLNYLSLQGRKWA
jgi:ABC-2 type transport system permease protein